MSARLLVQTSPVREGWRYIVAGLLTALCLAVIAYMPAQAQSAGTKPTDPAVAEVALGGPAVPGNGIAASIPRPALRPPLPFSSPQVGPIIKRAFADDIEKRTTAFLPTDLSKLTPITLPKNEKKWIRVDLSEQTVVAYEGSTPIRGFIISSGLSRSPTVTGEFHIKTKVKAQTMTGGEGAYYYHLPNVKWVQYFYQEYAFHGTYWHNDFGHPKSHGCINMTNADAKWLFDWAGPNWDGKSAWYPATKVNPGTLVIITK